MNSSRGHDQHNRSQIKELKLPSRFKFLFPMFFVKLNINSGKIQVSIQIVPSADESLVNLILNIFF